MPAFFAPEALRGELVASGAKNLVRCDEGGIAPFVIPIRAAGHGPAILWGTRPAAHAFFIYTCILLDDKHVS